MDIFKKLEELNFPLGEYVVVGSGPLAARGIREAHDLDIAVSAKLLKKLIASGKYQQKTKYHRLFLSLPGVEIISQLDWEAYPVTTSVAITTADIIHNFPFLNIQKTIEFKQALGRKKDFRDIKLLKKYLAEKLKTKN